jgi:hypothetical protein
MAKIVLIACANKKINQKAKAKEVYVSPLFKLNLAYAQSINPDRIFILSAKYGLLSLEQEIEPYNESLNRKPKEQLKKWADKVLEQMKNVNINLNNDKIIFLAGQNYRKYLLSSITDHNSPMQGLGIGKQLKWLKENTKNERNL